ncbi:MAG: hypothetical protein JXR96_20690 [Deltaproteobacteria bacterium]|nr:hypothetical protein [Deltaproteobacteria bacterium]
MRYELYLRLDAENKRLDRSALLEQLAGAGFDTSRDLPARAELGRETLRVEAVSADEEPAPEAPADAGPQRLAFSFPMSVPATEGERAIGIVMDVSEALGGELFDPQLGRLVRRADQDAICAAWRSSYEFHSGVSGSVSFQASPPVSSAPQDESFTSRYKWLIVLAIALFFGILLFRSCFKSWLDQAMVPPTPTSIPAEPER